MRQLVIGRGEVGSAIAEVLDCESYDRNDYEPLPSAEFDVLHIAIPYGEDFMGVVDDYESYYDPELVIVYSTVPIGTCEPNGWVHSPVEGSHPDLVKSMRTFPRFFGTGHRPKSLVAESIWVPHTKCIWIPSADHTEFLKLRSTARYGINIVFADYERLVADEVGLNWDYLEEYDLEYNRLYLSVGSSDMQRYILDPPHGVIGGHCVVPNAAMLNEQYPNPMLEMITAMGDDR